MGIPKLSLKYDEENTFIEHIVNEYLRFGCNEIVIVVNEDGIGYFKERKIQFPNKVKVVINEHPDWNRFYSLKIGAKSLSEIHPVFIHNVDNPFVNYDVLNELLNHKSKADYISPEIKGKGGHPILLSDKNINEIRLTQKDQMHFKEFLNQYPKIKVPVDDEKILANINTMKEYTKYFGF
jgi:CTP:molybdopterin cytidylyltransferase MocA